MFPQVDISIFKYYKMFLIAREGSQIFSTMCMVLCVYECVQKRCFAKFCCPARENIT